MRRFFLLALFAIVLVALIIVSQRQTATRQVSGIPESAETQLEAFQFAFIIMLPSILLSGFVFPREEMPLLIYWASFALPATWFIEILRGIILRGADAIDLMPSIVALTICGAVVLLASVMRFQKRLA